jgi:hypothetical protein
MALVASGVFPASGASRARVQRTVTVAAQTVDLDYAMSFGSLPVGVSYDTGCALELSKTDGTTARARISADSTGQGAIQGLVAIVDATRNGATDTLVSAPAPNVLSDQLGTLVWYHVHVGAIVDATGAHFSFDIDGGSVSGHVEGPAVPFTAPDGVVVSCGVDNAVVGRSFTSLETSYEVLIDDVALTACPR